MPRKRYEAREQSREFMRIMGNQISHELILKRCEEEKQKIANDPYNKVGLLRSEMSKALTEANKKHPENRINNTKQFVDILTKFVAKDFEKYTKAKRTDIKDLDKFVNFYSIQIRNLIAFDNEMVNCENPQCKESMVDLFLNKIQEKLPVLYSRFASLVLEKAESIANKEASKEVSV